VNHWPSRSVLQFLWCLDAALSFGAGDFGNDCSPVRRRGNRRSDFEWDPGKRDKIAESTSFFQRRQGFWRSFFDNVSRPGSSIAEQRFYHVGTSSGGQVLIVAMRTATRTSGLSALVRRRGANENNMKEKTEKRTGRDDLRREYDLSKLKGVRGKYAARYRAGTNLVTLSPDGRKVFPMAAGKQPCASLKRSTRFVPAR